jgi:hypothetical protein
MTIAEYFALVKQIDFEYLYSGMLSGQTLLSVWMPLTVEPQGPNVGFSPLP